MLTVICLPDETLSLLNHPSGVWLSSTLGDHDLTALKMHEYQDIQVEDALCRYRTGAFEYIIRTLFKRLDYPFSEQVEIDGAKPDFVMPSKDYLDERPLDCIIFTAKRTLRERWRQVVTEANKGYAFFLATIDNKVAKSQIEQMAKHKVYMVVPKKIKEENEAYSGVYSVLSFEEFFEHHLDPAIGRWQLS